MNKILNITLLLILFLGLGCNVDNKEIIKFLYDSSSEDNYFLQQSVLKFQNNNNVKVELDFQSFLSLKPYINTISKNEMPDMFLGVGDWGGELYQKNIIKEIKFDKFSSGEYYRYEDKNIGIIKNMEYPVFFYYEDKFSDKDKLTLDYIFSNFGNNFAYDAKNMYFHVFLASFFSADFLNNNSFDFSDKNFIKSIEFLKKYAKGKITDSLNYDAVVNLFAAKKLDIIIDGLWNYNRHVNNGAKVLELFPEKVFYGAKVYYVSKNTLNDKITGDLIFSLLEDEKKITSVFENPENINFYPLPQFPEMNLFWQKGNELLYKALFAD